MMTTGGDLTGGMTGTVGNIARESGSQWESPVKVAGWTQGKLGKSQWEAGCGAEVAGVKWCPREPEGRLKKVFMLIIYN